MESLLDRLVPELDMYQAPQARRKPGGRHSGLSHEDNKIVRAVERDVLWLFNSGSIVNTVEPEVAQRCRFARDSVLNYGLRHVFGKVVTDLAEIEAEVAQAMARFEPRVVVEKQTFTLSREGQLVEIALEGYLRVLGDRQNLKIKTDLQTLESRIESAEYG